jgi:precorrin-6x reductase
MTHSVSDEDFIPKSITNITFAGQLGIENLKRYAKFGITDMLGFIDEAHPAAGDIPQHAIPLADNNARKYRLFRAVVRGQGTVLCAHSHKEDVGTKKGKLESP